MTATTTITIIIIIILNVIYDNDIGNANDAIADHTNNVTNPDNNDNDTNPDYNHANHCNSNSYHNDDDYILCLSTPIT